MKTMIKRAGKTTLAACLFASFALPAAADVSELKEKLPAFIEHATSELGIINGFSVAVIDGNETVYEAGFGYADIENSIPVTTDTSFYIASTTKAFTGLTALLLADRGLIDLDKTLDAYFPEIDFKPELQADKITIRALLAHFHGLKSKAMVMATAYSGNHTPEVLLEIIKHLDVKADAPLGTYDYSNVGYNIFSVILEREFGKAWQDILAEEVFRPAGMTRTSAYMSDGTLNSWKIARPYDYGNETPRKALYLTKQDNTMHAAGGMIASAPDLARFIQAQLSEGKIGNQQVFPGHLIMEAQKSLVSFEQKRGPFVRTGYGMGLRLSTFEGQKFISHFGGFAGSFSHMSFMPEHGLGLVILANEARASQLLSHLLAGYIYDTMRGIEDVDEKRRVELVDLKERSERFKKRRADERAEQASRTWALSRNPEAYVGDYHHPLYGSLYVDLDADGKIITHFGNMHSPTQPYTDTDSLRVELVPGTGEIIQFLLDGTNIQALTYDGVTFTRR